MKNLITIEDFLNLIEEFETYQLFIDEELIVMIKYIENVLKDKSETSEVLCLVIFFSKEKQLRLFTIVAVVLEKVRESDLDKLKKL